MDAHLREEPPVFSDAAIKLFEFTIVPRRLCFRAHWQESIEILYIREGTMHVMVGTSTGTVSAGQFVFIPPKTPHRGVAGENGVHYDVLNFDVRTFYNGTYICQKLLPMLYEKRAVMNYISDNEDVIRCVDALCHRLDQNSMAAVSMIYELIGKILDCCLITVTSKAKTDIIDNITAYIEENFERDLCTADLCQRFGYTAAHLCRKFKDAIGLTPMNYLKIYRLERSRELIIGTELSISEIAIKCGYTDANYFTRCFTAHFGAPPTHYRKKSDS